MTKLKVKGLDTEGAADGQGILVAGGKFVVGALPTGGGGGGGAGSGIMTPYTPVLSGSGTALGNGTVTGFYTRNGELVTFTIVLGIGTTTTIGSTLTISLPVATMSSNQAASAAGYDASAGSVRTLGVVINAGASSLTVLHSSGYVNGTTPVSWAVSDQIIVSGTYRAATSIGGGAGAITVQDENVDLATAVSQIDFQGAGVTVTSPVAGEVVVNIPGLTSTPVVARARLTTSKTGITGGQVVTVAPLTELEDTTNSLDATTGIWTCPTSGLYQVSWAYRGENTSGGNGAGGLNIVINGTQKYPGAGLYGTTTGVMEVSGSKAFRFTAGDTVKFVYTGSGTTSKLCGADGVTGELTGFDIVKIGD